MNFSEAFSLAFPKSILTIVLVCAVLSAVGFYKYVYFLSIGYGFAIAGSGIGLLIIYGSRMSLPMILLCVLLIAYGLRLSGYLLIREIKSVTYRKTLDKVASTEKPMPIFVKAVIWIACFLMYTCQVSPVLYRLESNPSSVTMPLVSVVIMAFALIIETIADQQKTAAKKEASNRFCDTGLYKIVRCPNYLGELLFWTGVLISGFGALQGVVQWSIAILGYVLLVYVMFSGAKRLEGRQNKNYGDVPEYQAYVEKTPILLPLLPLYSLQKYDFIK